MGPIPSQAEYQSLARTAGALYLAIAICGGFSIGYVPSVVLVNGDAAATASNLVAHAGLYRAGIFADMALLLLEVVITAILFVMVRPYGPVLAVTALLSRAAMILVMGVNLVLSVLPFALATSGQTLPGLAPDALQASIMIMFQAHDFGVYVWQLFFGLHLVALGWLVIRTAMVPRAIGWGLLVGSFGYTLQGMAKLLTVEHALISNLNIGLLTVVTIAEIGFALWLLIRGVKIPQNLN